MIKITSKLLIATVLITSLAACKTTGSGTSTPTAGGGTSTPTIGGGTSTPIEEPNAFVKLTNNVVSKSATPVKVSEVKVGEYVKISLDGKEYRLSHIATSKAGKEDDYFASEGENTSLNAKSLKVGNEGNANLTRWAIFTTTPEDEANKINGVAGTYFEGNKTQTMPTTSTATYAGTVDGTVINRTLVSSPVNVSLDFNAEVNFENNSFDTTIGQTDAGGSFDVTNETISANGFSFDAASDATLNNEVGFDESITGTIRGSFYGDDANIMAGGGTLSNSSFVATASVLAYK